MLLDLPYLGEILSLSCAIIWATAVILFKKSGETVHPLGLNLFKNLLGLVLFLPTFMVFGERLIVGAPLKDYLLLMASGVIGIGLADTLFFKSLNLLGAGLSAIVNCLYSPFIIGLAVLFLSEGMSGLQLFGVFLIITAVFTVSQLKEKTHISRHDLILGILLGVLAMALMAIGIVMIKPLLDRSPLLWVIEVRLLAGCGILGIILWFYPGRQRIMASVLSVRNWRYMLPGSFVGAYLALVVWMGGMKYTEMSIASALNQTSNIFVFILAAIFLKEPVNFQRTAGIILAIVGVVMVAFFR
ncbi:DMT family transporter [candidate division KSB1 bacterium]|nr:DMT family transporter [candidate division KSB1 bacterium]